ncbi:glutamate 5-kinase [Candidatus Raskinella chloraquaticus]|uniref:Glutamate 5-kinase n=1 Tax=Candidatus Raskinella chloraquaticus TaxID=1951219 RepID=A0A1W9HUY5_9HYPH|nr:MAG: glutamate 5-kinase [Proteobacteria bacterium SG_bin8]
MGRKLSDFRRVVIKIGSATLVDSLKSEVHEAWLAAMVEDIARLTAAGTQVLVVSSGAIALGRNLLKLGRGVLALEESQAAAAIGQIALARAWSQALQVHRMVAGQILLTLQDTEERRRYLNARATIETLLAHGAVPVINENDTVATTEIRYGDNDRLAARVASMVSADCLVLLSDIDGLYTAPPARDPDASLIAEVDSITPQIEAMAGASANELARGGMATKIEAAKIALASGTFMVITSGAGAHPLARLDAGGRATWFLPKGDPVTARKAWIAGALEPRGAVVIDDGAARALSTGKSLLPAGVLRVEGQFSRGDAVIIKRADGHEMGRGLVAYDISDAQLLVGKKSQDIAAVLGFKGRSAMIHRDDMTLAGGAGR